MTRSMSERLADIAAQVGGTPRLYQFDAGHRASVRLADGRTISAARDMGDAEDAVEALFGKLVGEGLLSDDATSDDDTDIRHRFRLTYAGGATIEVLAANAQLAIVLAGRGRPESIMNLSVLERVSKDQS